MVDGHIESDVVVNDSIRICETLKKSDVFQHLSPTELLNIAQKMKKETFSAGDSVIRQGEEGDKFFIIGSGSVDVLIDVDADGHQERKFIRSMSDGEFFGEKALITGEPRSASIVARTPLTLYALGQGRFPFGPRTPAAASAINSAKSHFSANRLRSLLFTVQRSTCEFHWPGETLSTSEPARRWGSPA